MDFIEVKTFALSKTLLTKEIVRHRLGENVCKTYAWDLEWKKDGTVGKQRGNLLPHIHQGNNYSKYD